MRTATFNELNKVAAELGLRFCVNRDTDKPYRFFKGERVLWSVKTADEARRFIQACNINRSVLTSL